MNSEKNRIIKVLNYNKNWKTKYIREANKLKLLFKSIFVSIHHIGSTSIPNMAAKPTIDILIVVNDINKVDALNESMKKLGYRAESEYGIKGRRYFWKYPGNHKYHIHVFEQNDINIIRHLVFKEYLMENEERVKEYSNLKKILAEKHRYSINKYMQGKNDLIKKIETKALSWYKKFKEDNAGKRNRFSE